jgi:hypothetical protein
VAAVVTIMGVGAAPVAAAVAIVSLHFFSFSFLAALFGQEGG